MNKLRIVFMGTPNFAVASLKYLVEKKYNIVGVVTAADKPAGRGQKLQESAVKKYAVSQNIQVLQPINLKSEDFIVELKSLNADLQIIVAFRMLPKIVWQMPSKGTFNLHASLLPEYRGAAPINWAIINGEVVTGNTTFFIDEKIDTGNIILQEQEPIDATQTAGELHDKLMEKGALLVAKTIDMVALGKVETKPQPNYEPKTAYKLTKKNTKIDWNQTGESIHNLIRGLSPYPAAWCYLNNKNKQNQVKILLAIFEKEQHQYPVGKLVEEKKLLKVAVQNGFIVIQKMQLPGKKAMFIADLLNGYVFEEDALME